MGSSVTEERPRDYRVAAIRPRILGLARAPVGEPARPLGPQGRAHDKPVYSVAAEVLTYQN